MAWLTPYVLQNAHLYPDDNDGYRLFRHGVQLGRDGCPLMEDDVCIVFPSMLLVEIDYFHGFHSYAAGGPICQTAEDESDYLALELVGVARRVREICGCEHTRLLRTSQQFRPLQRAWRARRRVAACSRNSVWNTKLDQLTLDYIVMLAEGDGLP